MSPKAEDHHDVPPAQDVTPQPVPQAEPEAPRPVKQRHHTGLGWRLGLLAVIFALVFGALWLTGKPIPMPIFVVAEIESRANTALAKVLPEAGLAIGRHASGRTRRVRHRESLERGSSAAGLCVVLSGVPWWSRFDGRQALERLSTERVDLVENFGKRPFSIN